MFAEKEEIVIKPVNFRTNPFYKTNKFPESFGRIPNYVSVNESLSVWSSKFAQKN